MKSRHVFWWAVIVAASPLLGEMVRESTDQGWSYWWTDKGLDYLVGMALIATPFVIHWFYKRAVIKRELRRHEAEARHRRRKARMGFAEALALGPQVVIDAINGFDVIAQDIGKGVVKQEEINARLVNLSPHDPKSAQTFLQVWRDHASNVRKTTADLKVHLGAYREVARRAREVQEVHAEWSTDYGYQPPEYWFEVYQTVFQMRNGLPSLIRTFETAGDRWDPQIRRMVTELDRAVDEYVAIANEYILAIRETEVMAATIVSGVDRWNSRTPIRRLLALAISKLKRRRSPKASV
jgi:hypothetical protein